MMATTHALAGLLLALPLAFIAPEFAVVGAFAAIAGGVFPDADMPGAHRRTLHFPVYYSVGAVVAAGVALLSPVGWIVAAALFLAAAALHSLSDALGGGLELRPWEATSERAVYSHYHGRWWKPRRWVRYDGAPEDAALGALFALPSLLVFDGAVESVVLGAVAVSIGYVLIRRRMIELTQRVVDYLSPVTLDRPAARYVEGFR